MHTRKLRTIKPGMILRHYKGGLYRVVGFATHTETGEELVMYHSLSAEETDMYARPVHMFFNIIGVEDVVTSAGVSRFEEVIDF
jgi:hypothetical protein